MHEEKIEGVLGEKERNAKNETLFRRSSHREGNTVKKFLKKAIIIQ